MEYYTPDGKLRQGYFCVICGEPCNMYGTGHGHDKCKPNFELVEALFAANRRGAKAHLSGRSVESYK